MFVEVTEEKLLGEPFCLPILNRVKSQPRRMVKHTQTICLSVFGHFSGLALKVLNIKLIGMIPKYGKMI